MNLQEKFGLVGCIARQAAKVLALAGTIATTGCLPSRAPDDPAYRQPPQVLYQEQPQAVYPQQPGYPNYVQPGYPQQGAEQVYVGPTFSQWRDQMGYRVEYEREYRRWLAENRRALEDPRNQKPPDLYLDWYVKRSNGLYPPHYNEYVDFHSNEIDRWNSSRGRFNGRPQIPEYRGPNQFRGNGFQGDDRRGYDDPRGDSSRDGRSRDENPFEGDNRGRGTTSGDPRQQKPREEKPKAPTSRRLPAKGPIHEPPTTGPSGPSN
jgi:hypothetical protein